MSQNQTLDYGRPQRRRLALRPAVAIIAGICLAIGVAGFVMAGRNFTMPGPDDDLKPATMAEEDAQKQAWLDYSESLFAVGFVGLLLLPFSFRLKQAPTQP